MRRGRGGLGRAKEGWGWEYGTEDAGRDWRDVQDTACAWMMRPGGEIRRGGGDNK